jgi:hypothetical protein
MLAVWVHQVRRFRPELRVSALFYQDVQISIFPAPHLAFGIGAGSLEKRAH